MVSSAAMGEGERSPSVRSALADPGVVRLLREAIRRSLGDVAGRVPSDEIDQCARLWGVAIADELQRRHDEHGDSERTLTDVRQLAARTPSDTELTELLATAQADLSVQRGFRGVRGIKELPDEVGQVVLKTLERNRVERVEDPERYMQRGVHNQRETTRRSQQREVLVDPTVAEQSTLGRLHEDSRVAAEAMAIPEAASILSMQLPSCPRCRETKRPRCGTGPDDDGVTRMVLLLMADDDSDVPELSDSTVLAALGSADGLAPFHTPQGRSRSLACLLHKLLCLRWVRGDEEGATILERALRERIRSRAQNGGEDYAPDRRALGALDQHLEASRRDCTKLGGFGDRMEP